MSASAPSGVKSGLESKRKLPFVARAVEVTVWTPPTASQVTVSPGWITMDSGSYPLNQTIPPFASGDPMTCPPTFTWYVVAARALDAEKTKTNNDRIEMIARTFGVSHLDFVTLSHMTPGIGHSVFNARRDGPGPSRRAGVQGEQRPYGLPLSILGADRSTREDGLEGDTDVAEALRFHATDQAAGGRDAHRPRPRRHPGSAP